MPKGQIAIFTDPGAPIRLVETDIPPLQKGQLLVRNEYSTLCQSDLSTFTGKRREKTPTILGHEIAGRIEAFGPDASRTDIRGAALRTGDRVTWSIFAGDPEGEFARRGMPQKGKDLFKYGHEQLTAESTLHGGLASHTILRKHTAIVKIDEAAPVEVAAIINCAVATVAGALRLAGDLKQRRVLISGTGMLGLIACAMSESMDAKEIIALDIDADRLEKANIFGADRLVQVGKAIPDGIPEQMEKYGDVDIALEFSGAPEAMESTLSLLGAGGTAVWVGAVHPTRELRINAEQVIRRLWTIRGLHNYNRTDLINAVSFIEQQYRQYPFIELIRGGFSLKQVNEAFACALEERPFRVGISTASEV